MRTEGSRGVPSGTRSRAGRQGLLAVGSALICLIAAPVQALAAPSTVATATPSVPTPVPSPTCSTPACNTPLAAQLTLTQTVDRNTAAVGDTVGYTVTLTNTGSLAATAVTVDDALTGDAGYLVDDGTAGTANTFVGEPVTTVTRVLTGHYRWSYPVVDAGEADIVKFSAVITAPRGAGPAARTIMLTSTASTPGTAAATVTTTAAFTSRGGGRVRGATTGVPSTGSGLDAIIAGLLLLGGLGCIVFGVHARRREGFRGLG